MHNVFSFLFFFCWKKHSLVRALFLSLCRFFKEKKNTGIKNYNFPTTTLSFFIYFGQMISSSLTPKHQLHSVRAYTDCKSNFSLLSHSLTQSLSLVLSSLALSFRLCSLFRPKAYISIFYFICTHLSCARTYVYMCVCHRAAVAVAAVAGVVVVVVVAAAATATTHWRYENVFSLYVCAFLFEWCASLPTFGDVSHSFALIRISIARARVCVCARFSELFLLHLTTYSTTRNKTTEWK